MGIEFDAGVPRGGERRAEDRLPDGPVGNLHRAHRGLRRVLTPEAGSVRRLSCESWLRSGGFRCRWRPACTYRPERPSRSPGTWTSTGSTWRAGGATLVIAPTGRVAARGRGLAAPEGRDARRIAADDAGGGPREAGLHADHPLPHRPRRQPRRAGRVDPDRPLPRSRGRYRGAQPGVARALPGGGWRRPHGCRGRRHDAARRRRREVHLVQHGADHRDARRRAGRTPTARARSTSPRLRPRTSGRWGRCSASAASRSSTSATSTGTWRCSCRAPSTGSARSRSTRRAATGRSTAPARRPTCGPSAPRWSSSTTAPARASPRRTCTSGRPPCRASRTSGRTHLALESPDHNTAEDLIANFEESEDCQGHWLRASVAPDGQFTMTNGRNGYSRTYTAR